ncbi:MAG: hypothetical protein M0T74_03805 [Desulfitobacterium hafniense]|nr:hypothetical protein [Desulfitobacterium hafniense]
MFIETFNGSIEGNPDNKYILRLNYNKDNDTIWKDEQELRSVIKNLRKFAEELEAYASEIGDDTMKGQLKTYIAFVSEKANKCDPISDILNVYL